MNVQEGARGFSSWQYHVRKIGGLGIDGPVNPNTVAT
jgi:hypothetical protein